MTRFFLFLVHAALHVVLGNAQAVAYESAQQVETARLITLCTMGGFLVVPILFGIVYTKYLAFKLAKADARDVKQNANNDGNMGQVLSSKSGGMQMKSLDMKTNTVLRIWWKRQAKLYDLERDGEAPVKKTEDDGGISSPAPVREARPKKEKKEKKEKKGHPEKDESGDLLSPSAPKKHKKHKSKERAPGMESHGDTAGEDSPKKKSKKKKHNDDKVASSP